ncbi:hypothetical protein JM83_1793 [Gillisia sp. Hel_I_86]|nr:hypothetical protein JM83_1793 [Gillisia sp. Hel_I_86]
MFSCKNEECNLVTLKEIRENELQLNNRAATHLNSLTHVMNSSVRETDYKDIKMANYFVNKVFFKLNDKEKVFWFVVNKYRDRTQRNLMYRNEYQIFLEDLVIDNIHFNNESLSSQSIGIVNMIAKNSNPNGVR